MEDSLSAKITPLSDGSVHLQVLEGSQRLSVTLPQSSYNQLVQFAEARGISIAEAARRAIRRDNFIQSLLQEKGGRLMIETPDGRISYIYFDE
ncbi:ribbon-helix-helix protein, copG family [Nostoc cycadae WK-1]|uniref:Ribbon-helix-helix protein, copG family n=2 Tax=Nostoc cycadae TaxID=246795 RepID=A0A2H6LFB1_9NOSO|nr:ribbon-helix-helix protein, copG family [Nostoc cycadae WK-1]